jgi:hypothetical protein
VNPYTTSFVETAYIPSKVPEHEPWGRISTMPDLTGNESLYATNTLQGLGNQVNSAILELSYNDAKVGKLERGVNISRGKNWVR